jgi:hypothetical protein
MMNGDGIFLSSKEARRVYVIEQLIESKPTMIRVEILATATFESNTCDTGSHANSFLG